MSALSHQVDEVGNGGRTEDTGVDAKNPLYDFTGPIEVVPLGSLRTRKNRRAGSVIVIVCELMLAVLYT